MKKILLISVFSLLLTNVAFSQSFLSLLLTGSPAVDSRPYKVYTALLTQSGSNAPTATILENNIGSIVWSRSTNGTYVATLAGAFTVGKTNVITNGAYVGGFTVIGTNQFNANAIYFFSQVQTANTSTGAIIYSNTDSVLDKVFIEIRVYD